MNFQEFQNQLSMLRLSSAADSTAGELSGDEQQCHSCSSLKQTPHFSPDNSTTTSAAAAAVTAETPDPSPDKNILYGGGANKAKRYSNSRFSSSLEEPFPKRTATLYGGATTTTTIAGEPTGKKNHRGLLPLMSTNNNFQGFSKIPLQESPVTPSPAKPPLPPPLYRTFSDPTGSSSYTRKSPHCTLSRTASWSSNEKSFINNGESSTTMVKSPNVQELSGVVNNEESPTKMRLKRMKDGMREMRQWCDLMIQEEETSHEETKIVKDDEPETGSGEPLCEEAVWVERMGSCLILHFKCPCGNGYQILLCGNNCYYKLTNF